MLELYPINNPSKLYAQIPNQEIINQPLPQQNTIIIPESRPETEKKRATYAYISSDASHTNHQQKVDIEEHIDHRQVIK